MIIQLKPKNVFYEEMGAETIKSQNSCCYFVIS